MRIIFLAGTVPLIFSLAGCAVVSVAGTVVSTTASVAGTVVSTGAAVVGAGIRKVAGADQSDATGK